MELWQLYLLFTLIPNIGAGLTVACVLTLAACGFVSLFWLIDNDFDPVEKAMPRYVRRCLITGIVTGVLAIVTPSQSGLYTIIGGYYATNIDGIKDLPPNVVKAANKFLEQYGKAND